MMIKLLGPVFPSPCGEKVGINVATDEPKHVPTLLPKFPSPCGEKVGINLAYANGMAEYLGRRCFRPLAGKR